MNTYHVKFASDGDAHKGFWDLRKPVTEAGGQHHVAPSMGHGPAYVVAHLPEEIDPASIFSGHEYQEVPTVAGIPVDELINFDEEDDDLPFDYDDEDEEDEGWDDLDDALYLDEEDEDDESEEETGDESGADSSEESPVEGSESTEATTVGGSEEVPF
jgi:hypothetical protein